MQYSILAAACAAALGITAISPSDAKAQIIVYPQISSYPYLYGNYGSYWNPGFNYAYQWNTPFTNAWSYGWSNPFNYGAYRYSWYNAYPYGGYYNYWPRYYGRWGRWW